MSATRSMQVPDLGVATKPAKVIRSRGGYKLRIGATEKELPVGTLITEAQAKSLVGKHVVAAVSGKSIVAIAPWVGHMKPPKKWILCYLPAPDIFRQINQQLREMLRTTYIEKGVISQEVAAKLIVK